MPACKLFAVVHYCHFLLHNFVEAVLSHRACDIIMYQQHFHFFDLTVHSEFVCQFLLQRLCRSSPVRCLLTATIKATHNHRNNSNHHTRVFCMPPSQVYLSIYHLFGTLNLYHPKQETDLKI